MPCSKKVLATYAKCLSSAKSETSLLWMMIMPRGAILDCSGLVWHWAALLSRFLNGISFVASVSYIDPYMLMLDKHSQNSLIERLNTKMLRAWHSMDWRTGEFGYSTFVDQICLRIDCVTNTRQASTPLLMQLFCTNPSPGAQSR